VEGVHTLESTCHPIAKGKEPTPPARSKDPFLTTLYVTVEDFCQSIHIDFLESTYTSPGTMGKDE
jgi:hypothetical protein